MKKNPDERDVHLHTARVLLAESVARRLMGHTAFGFTLLEWAGDFRRLAMTTTPRDLFGKVGP
jgi:hypothetical protein